MIRRIEKRMEDFFANDSKQALMITGARQIGKTFIIREYVKKHYKYVIEINFLENHEAIKLFENAKSSQDILLRLSALVDVPMVEGETIIFFDEVQECKELVTAIKFLVEDGKFRYLLSGSLLGVELKDIRSIPVGYMTIMEMYPMDFYEFCSANKVSDKVLQQIEKCFYNKVSVDSVIHEKLMDLFHLYLIVGGMPAAVQVYLDTNNLNEVIRIQKGIISLYIKDIGKYDPNEKLYLKDIFELIPSEINAKNKRFVLKNLNEHFKFSRYEHSFIWLKEAGVALPTFCVQEPISPLLLSKSSNLFKLFLSDIGLLAAMYMDGLQVKILNKEKDINFGAIYENLVAQELKAHGFDLYFFQNKKQGEVDFVVEHKGKVLPIEVKSGKGYSRHRALDNIISNDAYDIPKGIVFCNDNLKKVDKVTYMPIYMVGFLAKEEVVKELIYAIDLSVLQ